MSAATASSLGSVSLGDLNDLPPTLTVPAAGRLLGLGREASYRAAASGQLPTIKFGRRLFVPTARLLQLLGVVDGERT